MNLKEKNLRLVSDEKIAQFSDLHGIGYLLYLSRENYYRLMGGIFILTASVACLMLSVHVLGQLLENLSADLHTDIYKLVAFFLALEIAAAVLRYFGSVTIVHTTNSIIYHVRKKLFHKLTCLPITYFDRQPLGRTLSRITTDVEGVEHFFSQILSSSLCAFLEIILIIVAMLLVDVRFGLLIIATAVPTILFALAFRRPLKFWLRVHKKLNALTLARFAEFANGFEIIKCFNLEDWSKRKYQELVLNNYHVHLRIQHWNTFVRPMIVLLCSLPIFFVILLGGGMVLEQALALSVFISFVRFTIGLQHPVRVVLHDIQIIQDALTSAERIHQTFLEIEEVHYPDVLDQQLQGDIKFEQVYLDYMRDKNVLRGISFHAARGMKIGLVGETGAGKTSTVNLIPALYNYSSGDILLDDIPLRKWSKPCVRKYIGYINQDVIIFRGTLRENIICSQQAQDKEILQLADRLGFRQRLRNLPQGLDSLVIDHGQNLSAGERQIIAFMRMMIKNPQILILDEATANVDSHYEEIIHRALFELMANKTCFIIAHRLATVQKCDSILVFKDGNIVEQGTHTSLTRHDSGYYRYLLQAMQH